MEETPAAYVDTLVGVFKDVRHMLTVDGTLWLNLGDSYANDSKWGGQSGEMNANLRQGTAPKNRQKRYTGCKPKDLIGIPWRVAFALQADGWWLRSDIVWNKPNAMPESVTDRPTRSHEFVFLLSKSERYYYDADAIKEPSTSDHGSGNGYKRPERVTYADDDGPRGNDSPWEKTATRNCRDVWTINTKPYKEAHFATFPVDLAARCILAGSAPGDTVLDPFSGAGTTGVAALQHNRHYLGVELNPEYVAMSERRLNAVHTSML